MVNTEIYLGSGASVTFVPEIDIYLKPHQTPSTAIDTATSTVFTPHGDFTNVFKLVNDLYVGCVLDFYDNGDKTTSHRITSNTDATITFHPALAVTIVPTADYFHIRGYGAPCPAPTPNTVAVADTTKRLNSDNWLGIVESLTFPSLEVEFKEQNLFVGGSRNFTHQYKGIETAGSADIGVVANHGAWLYYFLGKCSGISATTADPDVSLGACAITNGSAGGTATTITLAAGNTNSLSVGMYVTGTGITTGSKITAVLTTTAFTIDLDATDAGSITVTATVSESSGKATSGYYVNNSAITATGPLFYRTITSGELTVEEEAFCPPLLKGIDGFADMHLLTEPTVTSGAIVTPITYTFTEQEGDDLPSFALEQSYSKLPSSNTYRTNVTADVDEDLNFVLIATGNRVNSLTITANEKEEVKMTVNTMARKIHSLEKNEAYDARRGVTDNRSFKNYSDVDTFLEPFFFSSGSISMFGQNFLRITSLSIAMNNTLTEKRYVGIGSKSIQDHVPAQRTYEITFTALVTDDKLYNELINGNETTGSLIDIIFDKANGEQIRLKFDDYYLTTNNWPLPDDKGPVAVDATVKARTLNSCTVKTHWILQG
jgi:hypothetical protein|tara:strand:+ start:10738 stop:12543 length:1806 start_codon:yes stop_codon:yes gene_type:complete